MCGITGIYAKKGILPHTDIQEDLVNLLYHRGPDESGLWTEGPFFLGHRRLSIIDISGGGQPMATGDGRFVTVFNGEIYNYRDLRDELADLGYRFRTRSDTEVLLHGYREWGEGLPEKLTGMFALAIADRQEKTLFLARDRFGEKPLFFYNSENFFAFASEVRVLTFIPDIPRDIDEGALFDYLCLNYVPRKKTLIKGIHRLQPGHTLLLRNQDVCGNRYWSPPSAAEEDESSLEEGYTAWRGRFDRAVRLNLTSDVPVGIFLSGGMDSSLIAESAVRQGRVENAYCVDFQEETFSELHKAQDVADKLGLRLNRVPFDHHALKEFGNIIEHADDPFADSSCLPYWVLSRRAAGDHKVVLGGDGGDETAGGYLTYYASFLHDSFAARLPRILREKISRWSQSLPTSESKVSLSYKLRRFLRSFDLERFDAHKSFNGTWLPREAEELLGREIQNIESGNPQEDESGPSSRILPYQQYDLKGYLPNDILAKADRMSMAHGLEVRSPFLEHHLAGWTMSRPDRFKFSSSGRLKVLLRHAARKTFGKHIANQKKQGFSIPIHRWIRNHFRDQALETLSVEKLRQTGCLNTEKVRSCLEDHLRGRRSYGFEIWGLMVLVRWHEKRILNRPEKPVKRPVRRLNLSDRNTPVRSGARQ